MTREEMQSRSIDAFRAYRKGMKLARWAKLNELGAFEMNDAANLFRHAAELLNSVSLALLQELPEYSHLCPAKRCPASSHVSRSSRLSPRRVPAAQKLAA